MDMHLPYTEPISYRYTFAGERPKEFKTDSFLRNEVVRAARKLGDSGKSHVIDRYDNNLRYLDDVISAFIDDLPPDAIVAIFSDHGEEFWDHDDFEHGHTFYDELLRVPFILYDPNMQPGQFDYPISLLDLAPSITRAAGLPELKEFDGWAVQDAQEKDFYSRPLAFGRPLYGDDGWASLYQESKYIVRSGKEEQYNLNDDPNEELNTLENGDSPKRGRVALQEALQTEVIPTIRIKLNYIKGAKNAVLSLHSPVGILKAWRGTDPTKKSSLKLQVEEDTLSSTWESGARTSREIFIAPDGEIEDFLNQAEITLRIGTKRKVLLAPEDIIWPQEFKLDGQTILSAKIGSREASVSYTVSPLPPEGYEDIDAFDSEVSEELKALGYLDD
jgi:hypothetical protein